MEDIKTTADLKILVAECTAYDYKVELEERKPKSWLKSVSAFANTRGGSLFFGVDNDGLVRGLDDVQHVCEAISIHIRDRMDPLPDVEMIPLKMEDKMILQVKVHEGNYTPYYYIGDGQRVAYVRNGEESLPATAEEMVRLVLKGSNRTFDSLRTDCKTEYAERAVLEALVNHFIHRDYTVMGGEVHLDIYDDRLVITSPGGMYNGQKVQDLDIEEVSSDRRNPILADVMAQLDYMEKRGSGLKRICNETRSLESYKEDRKPKFKSSSSHFITTIYSMEYDPAVTKQSSRGNQVEGLSNVLSRDQVEYLLTSMKQASPAAEIRKLMGMTNASKFKKHYLDTLLEMGVIKMTQPDSPNSPTQRYVLTEEGRKLLE